MRLAFNDDQRALRESVQAWLGKEYPHPVWRDVALGDQAGSPRFWTQMAQMGWLAAPLPERHGGLGGGVADAAALAECLGGALVLEPFVSSVVLGAGMIQAAASAAQQDEWLPRIAEGRLRIAVAQAEASSRFELHDVQTRAQRRASGWRISGAKVSVWDAPDADWLLVLARTAGGRFDRDGLGLFVVPRDASGVSLQRFPMIDRRPGAHVSFNDAPALAGLGHAEAALPVVQRVTQQALAVLANEACGAMQAAIEQTVAYLQQRRQFGQPLADFQVLRHRVVDMQVQLECSRSMALHAAFTAEAGDTAQAERAAIAAKVQAGRAGRWIGHQAIQLHGGMGMTDELAIGHVMKRLLMLDTFLGNADHHQQTLARLASPHTETT
ncbi:MAG: acyl-CoA dehydrogenase family protein [Hydrogenophaga sp.]|uniref:acyl-CoA dehydrogenase family protein n=1 Tax=Hydrogenophaga sp. TaxID=1904254 RepID=UPI003D0F1AF9